jgi:nucleotide-binding universal stress UspA family protein
MKTILAAVDFSPASETVIKASLDLARATKGRVVLLSVVQPPLITSDYAAAMLENYEALTAAAEKSADRRLHVLEQRLRTSRIPVRTIRLHGAPVTGILVQAKELRADYLVMGSHGHTAFYDLLVGSTTHGVLRRSPCPVVIVPAKKRKSPAV